MRYSAAADQHLQGLPRRNGPDRGAQEQGHQFDDSGRGAVQRRGLPAEEVHDRDAVCRCFRLVTQWTRDVRVFSSRLISDRSAKSLRT